MDCSSPTDGEALRGSSSSCECNDLKDPKTDIRFFCSDFLRGRGVSLPAAEAAQPAVSDPAVPGRRICAGSDPLLGLWERPKKPEFRRPFLSRVRVSSEGVRSWSGGRTGFDIVRAGPNTLRLFLRSRLPVISAISWFWEAGGTEAGGNGRCWRDRSELRQKP
jgi:hypothetical protein